MKNKSSATSAILVILLILYAAAVVLEVTVATVFFCSVRGSPEAVGAAAVRFLEASVEALDQVSDAIAKIPSAVNLLILFAKPIRRQIQRLSHKEKGGDVSTITTPKQDPGQICHQGLISIVTRSVNFVKRFFINGNNL